MSEPRPIRRVRRREETPGLTRIVILGTGILVVLIALSRLGNIYVDWLWFQSVGRQDVFTTRLIAEAALFLIGGLAFFVVFAINTMVAIRLASRRDVSVVVTFDSDDGSPIEFIPRAQSTRWHSLLVLVALGGGALLAILVGAGLVGSWDVVLRFLKPTTFGVSDPLFGQDISFFVFTLPMYRLLQGWFVSTMVLSLIGTAAIYAVKLVLPQIPFNEQSSQGQVLQFKVSLDFGTGIKAHVSILGALLALGFAWQNLLDIYDLVYAPSGLMFGASFTDVNARLPVMWLMVGIAVLFGLLVLVNIGRRGYRLPLYTLAGWIALWILAGGVYPSMVQRLQVQPSELDRERTYLEYNINLTRKAYALDSIAEVEYPAEDAVTAEEVSNNPTTLKNIRLWDPEPLLNTYNQIQSIRLYYDFLGVDVDRYEIDGEYRQVMLSPRELSPAKLASQAQTWVNQRLQFTHGYGVAMSPVNEVTPEGLPELFLQDVPTRGKMALERPEIYYGENTNDYVIVNTTTPEFDYPKGDDNVYVEYRGNSGVPVGSLGRRLLFAWKFGDPNILLAGAITADSKILFNRNITERAKMVAPFLMFDRDPYIVVADKRLYWILDAYTYTDRYPYSHPVNLGGGSNLNYLRNSVKIVMDAYDGSMQFYVADTLDPIIRTYSAIFPGLFANLDSMPQELRFHLRYPQDLFRVQAELYRTYHMKDARVFYNKEDLWNIPNEIYEDKQVPMQPYYVIMRLPGEQKEEFVLILPYTPPSKNNMITWLAARSDGDAYGKLVAFKYPKEKLIFGPMQIEARIDQDPRISEQLTLWNQAGSRVIRGNMIVIPIGKSNLYVEPIYLQSEQTKLPEMKRVILATGNTVVMEPTVSAGIERLFPVLAAPTPQQGIPAASPGMPQAPATPPGSKAKPEIGQEGKALLERISKLQEELKALEGDLRGFLESQGSTP